MRLEVADAVLVHIATRVAGDTAGVVRLHATPWNPTARLRGRGRGVEVDRPGGQVVVSLRLVLDREHAVVDVVRAVQRSVAAEVQRLTGLAPQVSVTVVDLD